MRANLFRCLGITILTLSLFSCKKETETVDDYHYQPERLTEILPLQIGKYITYHLDSTVFTNFNGNTEIHSYQEKNIVDAQLTDNLGRPSFRMFRFIRDAAGLEPWVSAGSYFITLTGKSVEVVDNNFRIITLQTPVKQDFTWKGNQFLFSEPYKSYYSFSGLDMKSWDFWYSSLDESLELNGNTINDVTTVIRVDEAVNLPIDASTPFASVTYAVDKYAKGLGLIYQELTLWEYQQNLGGPAPYKTGFGVKRSMIDHN